MAEKMEVNKATTDGYLLAVLDESQRREHTKYNERRVGFVYKKAYFTHLSCIWRHLSYIVRHKWFVFHECCKLGVPTLGVLHDISKLRLSEFGPYIRYFYGWESSEHDEAFDFACLLHQKRNKHHWQWWVLMEDDGGVKVLPMPDTYRREMLADWVGASKAIRGKDSTPEWYEKNKDKMQLHPQTREWVEWQMRKKENAR